MADRLNHRPSIRDVQRLVARHFHHSLSTSRRERAIRARWISCWLCEQYVVASRSRIAREHHRDPTTLIASYKRMTEILASPAPWEQWIRSAALTLQRQLAERFTLTLIQRRRNHPPKGLSDTVTPT